MNEIKEINNLLTLDHCPLCDSANIKIIGLIKYPVPVAFSDLQVVVSKQPEYWHCRGCGSYFTQNVVSEGKAKEIYSKNTSNKWNYVEFEKDKTADLIGLIRGFIKTGDSVLDVGCNDGNFLNFVKKIGAKTFGVEFSQIGRGVCEKNGHQVWGAITDIPDGLKFDLIFAFDLVEHLYGVEYFFDSYRRFLKDNGRLVILTGNPNCLSARLARCRWWYINNPEHVIFPSRKFFSEFKGFDVVDYHKVFNSRGYYLISVYNFLKPYNILKIIAKLILRRYDGTPLLGKDHALVILKKI